MEKRNLARVSVPGGATNGSEIKARNAVRDLIQNWLPDTKVAQRLEILYNGFA